MSMLYYASVADVPSCDSFRLKNKKLGVGGLGMVILMVLEDQGQTPRI